MVPMIQSEGEMVHEDWYSTPPMTAMMMIRRIPTTDPTYTYKYITQVKQHGMHKNLQH